MTEEKPPVEMQGVLGSGWVVGAIEPKITLKPLTFVVKTTNGLCSSNYVQSHTWMMIKSISECY